MKKIYILPIFICFLFANCEKVIDVDVPSIAPKLVIDATFEVLFDEDPVRANTAVKLSLSADYFDDEIPTVTNATVFVTNLANNAIINFTDANADGTYTPTSAFIPADDVTYELTVIYENETYKAEATKVKSTPFVSVVQGDETLFTGDEIQLKIEFQDDETVENYYLLDYTNNVFLALDDRFFNGSLYNFSSFYQEDEIEVPTTVTIKMHGITKEYYTYFEVLISQSGQNSGGPFESVPASLLGNIINTTNDDNFPLGYFHISETDTFTIDLVENE